MPSSILQPRLRLREPSRKTDHRVPYVIRSLANLVLISVGVHWTILGSITSSSQVQPARSCQDRIAKPSQNLAFEPKFSHMYGAI